MANKRRLGSPSTTNSRQVCCVARSLTLQLKLETLARFQFTRRYIYCRLRFHLLANVLIATNPNPNSNPTEVPY